MSDSTASGSVSVSTQHGIHSSPNSTDGFSLTKFGGLLGVIACAIGMTIFLIGCAGREGLLAPFKIPSVFALAVLPLVISVPGLLLSLAGGSRRNRPAIDPGVLGAVFVNLLAFSGALLEIIVWQQWGLFYSAPGGG